MIPTGGNGKISWNCFHENMTTIFRECQNGYFRVPFSAPMASSTWADVCFAMDNLPPKPISCNWGDCSYMGLMETVPLDMFSTTYPQNHESDYLKGLIQAPCRGVLFSVKTLESCWWTLSPKKHRTLKTTAKAAVTHQVRSPESCKARQTLCTLLVQGAAYQQPASGQCKSWPIMLITGYGSCIFL